MINARAETIQSSRHFVILLPRNVLLSSDGFMNGNEKGRTKQPYRFQIKSKGVYGFAGLYDEWKDSDGESLPAAPS